MSDHNAEGGKKVEPCNLCGKAVTYTLAMSDYVGGDVRPNCDCFAITCDEGLFLPDDWNDMQRRILEQRRKDFEAARIKEQGVGDVYRTFDDYLASEKK